MTSSRRRRQLRARRDHEPFVDGLPPDQSTPLTIGGREVGRVSNMRTVDGDLIGDVTIPTDGWTLVGDSRPEFAPDARIDILTRYGEWQYGRTAGGVDWAYVLQYRPAANMAQALSEALERVTPAELDDVVDAIQQGAPVEHGMHWWGHSVVNSWGGWGARDFGLVEPNSAEPRPPLEPWPEARPEPVEMPGSRLVVYARFEEFPSPPPHANRDCGHVDLTTGLCYYWTGLAWAQEAEEGVALSSARRALASVLRREEVPGAPEPTPVEPLKTKRQVRF